jgi:hypothetical protein
MSDLLQTEYPFTLPRGYVDEDGDVHRRGTMRLATAEDEIAPYKDPRVQANEMFLVIILLARVIELEDVQVTPKVIGRLFASDLAYLQELYNRINGNGQGTISAVCPECAHEFELSPNTGDDRLGEP